jgi:pimeloyl-ACP methyl ester carboxylesterase
VFSAFMEEARTVSAQMAFRTRRPEKAKSASAATASVHASARLAESLPWGFRLDEISIPVHIWYGMQDARFQGRGRELVDWIAGRIPHCLVVAWKDAGHMGLVKH